MVVLAVAGGAGAFAFVLPGPAVAMSISPATVTVAPTATQQFTALLTDAKGRTVGAQPAWSSTGGITDGSGRYTAATATGDFTVVATYGDLSARATVTIAPGAAATLDVSPSALNLLPAGKQQLTAVAKDQWGNQLANSALQWEIRPVSLGTLTSLGMFAATPGRATGELVVTSGSLSKTIPVTVCPRTDTKARFTFNITCSARADIFAESTISAADAKSFAATVDDDVLRVQTDFGRTYAQKPVFYLFKSAESLATGLQSIFSRSLATATKVLTDVSAMYLLDENVIAMDWAESKDEPSVIARHELTHMLIHQIVGQDGDARVPLWLNEGSAVVEETTAAADWELKEYRYVAASMAATKTLPALADMTTTRQWNSRTGDDFSAQYAAAYEAVLLLRDDLTAGGVERLFDLIARGSTFESAYTTVSGKQFSAFAAAYADRVKALAPTYPGVATASDTPAGPGVSVLLHGFRPSSAVRLTIVGGDYQGGGTRTVSKFGTYFTWLGATWPAGTYTVTAVGANGTVKVVVTK